MVSRPGGVENVGNQAAIPEPTVHGQSTMKTVFAVFAAPGRSSSAANHDVARHCGAVSIARAGSAGGVIAHVDSLLISNY